MTKQQALDKLDTLTPIEVEQLIEDIYEDYEEEAVSSPLGYLEHYAHLGRFKPDTKFRIYVKEVEEITAETTPVDNVMIQKIMNG